MRFMEFIDWRTFLVSLAIGLLFIYIIEPPMKTVYVFPTPENTDKVQYVDHANTFFDFTPKETQCPADESMVENYTVQ